MTRSFTLGVVAGISSLALAVPVLAQLSSAQESGDMLVQASDEAAPVMFSMRGPDFSLEGIQERIDHDASFLSTIDAMIAVQKTATQAHKDALTAALAITDDTAREAAVKAADEAFHTAVKEAISANPELTAAPHMFFAAGARGMKIHRMHGPMPEELAEKLGMTANELKAALDSGKTIEELAKEKGVDLPMFTMKVRGPGMKMFLEELDMTQEELKAALESGKSIEEIADEKGVELPERPAFKFKMKGGNQ